MGNWTIQTIDDEMFIRWINGREYSSPIMPAWWVYDISINANTMLEWVESMKKFEWFEKNDFMETWNDALEIN